jgi:hypothetical protein
MLPSRHPILAALKAQEIVSKKAHKENKIRTRAQPKRPRLGLSKEQRYFEERKVVVNPSDISQLGLYQAVLHVLVRVNSSKAKI